MINDKDAYLIMAHQNERQLLLLLRSLDYEKHDFYIHIDKKSNINIENFRNLDLKGHIFFLKERINIRWGSYSQIECEINLLKKALEKKYRFYHLISGMDFPLKAANKIYEFFSDKINIEFLHFDGLNISRKEYNRVDKYHFIIKRKNNYVEKILIWILNIVQFAIHRVPKNKKIFKGANWFHISNNFAEYVISQERNIKRNYMFTRNGDEIFMQTLLYNSKYISNLYNQHFNDDYSSILYKIDWKKGNPYIFRENDFDELIDSDMLFCRKVDITVDENIIIKLFYYNSRGEKL